MNFTRIEGLELLCTHSIASRRVGVSCYLPRADCLLPHQSCAVITTEDQRVVRFNAMTLGAAFQSGR